MLNKRGQFYIIAAVIIVMILSGMAGVSTYSIIKSEPKTIYNIRDNLKREGMKLVDYGIFNEGNLGDGEDLDKLVQNFAGVDIADYFLKKTNNANIIFIYGNKVKLNALQYDVVSVGDIKVGGSDWGLEDNRYNLKENVEGIIFDGADIGVGAVGSEDEGYIKVTLLGNTYDFELEDNQMFYFVIVQQSEDKEETFVEKSEKNKGEKRPGGGIV